MSCVGKPPSLRVTAQCSRPSESGPDAGTRVRARITSLLYRLIGCRSSRPPACRASEHLSCWSLSITKGASSKPTSDSIKKKTHINKQSVRVGVRLFFFLHWRLVFEDMAESEADTPSTPIEFESKYFEFDGVRLPPFCRGKMEEIANFSLRSSDIWIVTYPKSGKQASASPGVHGARCVCCSGDCRLLLSLLNFHRVNKACSERV